MRTLQKNKSTAQKEERLSFSDMKRKKRKCDYYKNIKEGEPGTYEEIKEHKPNQFYEICSKVSR